MHEPGETKIPRKLLGVAFKSTHASRVLTPNIYGKYDGM